MFKFIMFSNYNSKCQPTEDINKYDHITNFFKFLNGKKHHKQSQKANENNGRKYLQIYIIYYK